MPAGDRAMTGKIVRMRAGCFTAVGVALILIDSFSAAASAAERDITAIAPLERANPSPLDKANGIGPRFRFLSAPPGLTTACALSIGMHVNDGDFVDDASGRSTAQAVRERTSGRLQLDAADAARAPLHTNFALKGDGPISGASCANFTEGSKARGYCTAIVSGNDYTIVDGFDPVACGYDNVAVGKALISHLSVGSRVASEPERDCATGLAQFVADVDELLAKKPHDILDVYAVLNRHFPLHGCAPDEASRILKKSKYFRGESGNGPHMRVFSISSATGSSRGVAVTFGISDTGDSHLPSAMWWPPYP
jgi:hypothetical protein